MNFKSLFKYNVVGIGASPLDTLIIVNHFPTKREVNQALDMAISGGGPVGTALVTLAKLSMKTAMIDCIGDDFIGTSIIKDYQKQNVDTSAIQIKYNHVSSSATILVEQSTGNRAIFFTPMKDSELEDISLFEDIIKSAQILHINGRHKKILPKAIKIAKDNNVKISFDGGADRYNEFSDFFAKNADICILAKDFADKYTKETSIEKALTKIINNGSQIAGITVGKDGSYIMDEKYNIYYQKAFNMGKIIDTTGCGDSYHGGFLYGLLNNYSLQTSAQIASAIAAMNTQKLGGRGNLADLNKLKQFLLKYNIQI